MNFTKLFDKEALMKRIKEQGKALTKLVVSELVDEFLKLLHIPKVRYNQQKDERTILYPLRKYISFMKSDLNMNLLMSQFLFYNNYF